MTAIVLRADARNLPLPDASVDLIVTSPPYFGLRDYRDGDASLAGQIGSEATPREYVAALLDCTREWVRVLKPSGSVFVNLGDKYSNGGRTWYAPGSKHLGETVRGVSRPDDGMAPKSLLGLPWRYALGCVDDLGLILRAEIIWAKPNGLPESVTDRVRRSHEQVFHFTRQPRYYSAVDEVREPHTMRPQRRPNGRPEDATPRPAFRQGWPTAARDEPGMDGHPLGKLPGSVWEIASQPLTVPAHLGTDHFAAYPMELPRRIIAGWSPPGICTRCGEGRRPVVDKQLQVDKMRGRNRPARIDGSEPTGNARGINAAHAAEGSTVATITGYACACPQPDAPTRPSLVVDPFGGTGTTALVADALGRTGLSFDRSADYCRLARWRTTDPGERAKAHQVPKPPPVPDGQGDLLGLLLEAT